MKLERGQVALVTGASRGIGVFLAETLAKRGLNVALAARDEAALEAVATRLRGHGVTVAVLPFDAGDPAACDALIARTEAALGPVDLLVNNAGLEDTRPFVATPPERLAQILAVNLEAPIRLSRAALPGMKARGRGHVVNVASLAGLSGTPHGEIYCATKHGLVGFTRAARATLRAEGSPVGVSAVCPGFISEVGMYEAMKADSGAQAPALLGTSPPGDVADVMIRAIEKNLAEPVVNRKPVRPLLGIAAWFPDFAEWLGHRLGIGEVFLQAGAARERG